MADENTPQQPMNPDLLGYPSVEALVAAKRASDVEAKRLFDENQKKDALLSQVLTNGFPNGRQDVPDRRNGHASPEDRLTQFGVPVDALGEWADPRIDAAVNRVLGPLVNGVKARSSVTASHPDYVQFEQDVAQFIETDPDLSARYPKMFEADPVGAMEYAFLKFGDSRRRSHGSENGTRPTPSDAQIPSSRAGEGRRVPDQSQALQDAMERFQRSGSSKDAENYARLRLRTVIKDDFLNQ